MSQVALAWVNGRIASSIVGLNLVERVDESLVSQLVLGQEDVEYLEEARGYFFVSCFCGCADGCCVGMSRGLLEVMLDVRICTLKKATCTINDIQHV